ncbi:MAG TPA: hypothetical protein VG738_11735 [Chitinophagaceae bacterium]|nr:hypothetical protein [Chitinophagaceae bacterium]
MTRSAESAKSNSDGCNPPGEYEVSVTKYEEEERGEKQEVIREKR